MTYKLYGAAEPVEEADQSAELLYERKDLNQVLIDLVCDYPEPGERR